MSLRKFIEGNASHIVDKEIIEEIILPSTPQQWHVDLARLGTKSNSPVKDVVSVLENFEDCEIKFDINPNNDHRKTIKMTIAKMTGKIKMKNHV